MVNVFLLLGGNIGNRQLFLQQAIDHIAHQVGPVVKKSAVYETQAWGKTNEADYLNQVVEVETALSPQEVLKQILRIEVELGRERKEKWGARTIDIDILLYDVAIVNEADLVIPHPQLHHRRFTLEPLAEIAPQLIHPLLNKTIMQLKFELQDCLVVKKL